MRRARARVVAGMVGIVGLLAACSPLFDSAATLSVSSSGGAILVQWPEAIESDEGQVIASYRIDVDGVEVARVPSTVRSCQLTKVASGAHTVSVTAYDSAGEWSGTHTTANGRLSAQVTGPSADPTGSTPGCVGYGVTEWATALREWRTITTALPATGSTANPGTCAAGTTSSTYRSAALAKLNAFRRLAGVSTVTEDAAYSTAAQKAALLMAANTQLSHTPPVTWRCYTADASTAALESNLGANVVTNPATQTYDFVTGFVRDGTDAGHRRGLLCPGTTKFGIGDANTPAGTNLYYQWNATKVLPGNGFTGSVRDRVVAWPPPGVVPVDLARTADVLGLFSVMVPGTHNVTSAQVSVTSSPGGSVAVNGLLRNATYCSPTLVWTPGRAPAAGETWTVRITGLKDAAGASYSTVWTTTFRNSV